MQHCSGVDGWRGCRVDWLVLARWMDSVVVENWNHSARQRETLGRSWNDENRCTANRGGRETWKQVGAFDIKYIYTQACFFFLPSASSFGSPPPLFLSDCLKWAHVHSQAHVIVPEYMSTELSSSRTLTSLMLSQESNGKIKLFWFVVHGAKSFMLLPTWDTCCWLKVWKVLDKSTFEKIISACYIQYKRTSSV